MRLNKNTLVPLAILLWLGASVFIFFRIPQNVYLLTTYPAFFRAIFELQFRLPDSFIGGLLAELVSLALHGVVGILFLRLCLRLPRWIEWIAGVFLGIGLANFILELWAIPFLLNRWTVLLSLMVLACLLGISKKRWGWVNDEEEILPCNSSPDSSEKILYRCAWGVLSFIIALSFYHALFFPVNYWDALILYIHYGKITYQQGGFPILACLQVGLGLGANYPHLYPLHQAATAMLAGHWSDIYGQLLPPLAGLGSVLVIFHLGMRLFKNRLAAVFSALVFRSIPYVSTYYVYESDYSLVMLYTALFLLFLERFLAVPSLRRLTPILAVSAIFPHINYLGWIVWPPIALAIAWRYRALADNDRRWLWKISAWLLFWFGLGLTWYIRNWIVTGNPVYAFFPEIFGGKNINLEVLQSCNQEWTAHGLGAAQFGHTLWAKIGNSLLFFAVDWRFSPLVTGIMLPGLAIGWKRKQPFFLISASLFALYFIYQYIISGLYWYHTIAVFPILGLFAGRFLAQIENRIILAGFCILLSIAALIPGGSVAVMGSKIHDPRLPLFAHPGLSLEEFNRFAFPDVAPVWRYVNKNLEKNAVVLTHDNRYHVYRDDIQIIHLDDCGLTPFYGKPYPEVHRELLRRGCRYYLYIHDEDDHPITARLGHKQYLNDPKFFTLLYSSGSDPQSARLYRLAE